MRITVFTDDYFPRRDGATYTVDLWKRELEERGHEVSIVYPGSSKYEAEEGDVPVLSVPDPLYHDHYIPLVPRFWSLPETDIVHCHSQVPLGLSGRIFAWRKDIPSVFTYHTSLEEFFEPILKIGFVANIVKKLYIKAENRFLSTFDLVTSNIPEINRDVDPVELPVGIDMEKFRPVEKSYIDDLSLERPILGYSGRISEEKNLDETIEMAREFDGTVLIQGEGRYREKLEEKAPENVVFRNFADRDRLKQFYSGIDVFVTASRSDTLSLTTLEANACGTPVVAPDTPPFDRTISSEQGAVYEPGDLEDFREKVVETLSRQPDTRKAVERFSVKKTVDRLEKLYRELD